MASGSAHRNAALAALPAEQRPVAEQVLRGGLPAVRQAIEAQNAEARSEGRPEVGAEPLLTLAEQLLGRLKAAAWRDRAEAAVTAGDQLSLRDLRSVVAGADSVTRDDETRQLASKLRANLDARITQIRQRWIDETAAALDGDKVLRALRASARSPDPGSRLPAELAVRLSQAAGAAMTPETSADRWSALLDAAATSPVRRTVKPMGLPKEPGEDLMAAIRHATGRVPALAALLGIDMPPPPAPPRSAAPMGPQRSATPTPSRSSLRAAPPRSAAPPAQAAPVVAPAAWVPATEGATTKAPTAEGPAPEGAAPEGAAPEGAAPEGPAPEGAAPEGAAPEGAAPEGAAPEGPAARGPAAPGGPAAEGPAAEGPGPSAARADEAPPPESMTSSTGALS